MRKFLTTVLLTAALMAPVAIRADDNGLHRGQNKQKIKQKRYYDRNARDWHDWNDNEAQAYSRYAQENRLRQLQFERTNAAQQRAYWAWRHAHPEVYGDRR